MKVHIKFILIFCFVFCTIFMSGCSETRKTVNNSNDLSSVALNGSQKYGHVITKNGVQMYVNQDGIVTSEIVNDGYTLLYVELGLSTSSDVKSYWIGLNSANYQFDEGAVLRVQPITKATGFQTYQEYYDMIDDSTLESYSEETMMLFHVWFEKQDGTKLTVFDSSLDLLFEESDSHYLDVVGLNSGVDEALDKAHLSMNIPPIGEKHFIRIGIRQAENILAFFTE